MSRTIFTFLVFSISLLAQVTSIPGATGGGGGATASGYSAAVTAQTTLTVTAATHGQGTSPVAGCFDNSTPAVSVSCSYTRNTSGDVVFTWAPAFTGTVNIWTGAGTSGISGGGNLTTVGAIPYVSASGVLNQDATYLYYDPTNHRLTGNTIRAGGTGPLNNPYTGPLSVFAPDSFLYVDSNAGGTWGMKMRGSGGAAYQDIFSFKANGTTGQISVGSELSTYFLTFQSSNAEVARFAVTTGNLLLGGGTTDGNYKFDIQKSGSTGTLRVYDQTATTGSTLAVIQAGAGQSGNLTEWRNNAGSALANVTSAGDIYSATLSVTGNQGSLNTSGLLLSSGSKFAWSSTSSWAGSLDTGLARAAAGYLKVTDGSTGLGKIVVSQSTPAASSDACTAGAIWADATYIYACTASGTIKRATLATF